MKHANAPVLRIALILLLALAAWAACDDDESDSDSGDDTPSEDDDDDDDVADDDDDTSVQGCPRGVVTSGLGLRWERVNHRISLWDVHPQVEEGCPAGVPEGVELSVGSIGGNWSTGETATDFPTAYYEYFATESKGTAGFAMLSQDLWIDAPSDRNEVQVEVDLQALELTGYEQYAVLLSGLSFNTDVLQVNPDYPTDYNPAHGYTSRGIGAGVEALVVDGDTALFTVWARIEHGQADRQDMNRAIPHARTQATVHAMLVGINDGSAHVAQHGYTLTYDPPRLLFQPIYERAPEPLRLLGMQGESGMPVAFAALQHFDFRLFGSEIKGDYMREFSVFARLNSYDPASGSAEIDVDGFASNVGLLTYETMENDFSAGIALIQLSDGESRFGSLSREFETGTEIMSLP